jgi:surface polysaccharide O-acyltransferase-like enzyme
MKNTGIEALRVIGLFAVVCIHANSLKLFGDSLALGFILDELARFAVPSFFMFSGMFWKDSAISHPQAAIRQAFTHLAPIFTIWIIIYFVLDFTSLLYAGTFKWSIAYFLITPISGGAGFHLWFLPALLMGTIITLFSIYKYGLKLTFILSIALYLVGVLLGFILVAIGYKVPSFFFRNGVFEAPIFLLLGFYMRSIEFRKSTVIVIIVIGAVIHISEGLIRGTYPSGHEYSVGTIFYAIGVVALFKSARINDYGWGRDVLGAYLIHLLYLKLLDAHLPGSSVIYGVLSSLFVALISLATSRLIKMSRSTSWLIT